MVLVQKKLLSGKNSDFQTYDSMSGDLAFILPKINAVSSDKGLGCIIIMTFESDLLDMLLLIIICLTYEKRWMKSLKERLQNIVPGFIV